MTHNILKKIQHGLSLCIILTALSFTASSQNTHIGTWQGNAKTDNMSFIFKENNEAAIIEEKDTISSDKIIDGLKMNVKYSINYNVKPTQIDIVISAVEKKESLRLIGILQFIDNDTMKIRMSDDSEKRPTNFLPEKDPDIIYLTRVK